MSRIIGCRRLALALATALLGAGCNASALPYFLAGCPEPKKPAGEMELVVPEKAKEAKVLILVHSSVEPGPDFVGVDRELSGLLSRRLTEACKENDQKVTVVLPNKVQEFKNEHPDWHSMNLRDIGTRFSVDYVIGLDIESLSLYEKGSANTLYRGRAEITITLVNMHKPDDDPIVAHASETYPEVRGPIPADDQNARQFYLAFVNYLSHHLCWRFTDHPIKDEFCQ